MHRLIVCVVLVGCGGDDGGSPIDIDSLGIELAMSSCARQFDCCSDAEIMDQYMGITHDGQPITTEEACVSFTNAVFSSLAIVPYKESIAMGRIEYDGAAAGGCVAAIERVTCAEYSSGLVADEGPDCRPFLIPKVADGGGCTEDYECTSTNCDGEMTPLGGPRVDGMCAPIPAAGQPCDDKCTDGYYCGFPPTSGPRACQPLRADGMQCNVDSQCASDHCDTDAGMCAPKPLTCDGR